MRETPVTENPKATAKKTAAAKPEKRAHEVTVTDVPDSYAEQGGRINALCTCGWSAYDRYERDRFAGAVRAVVQEAADRHVNEVSNPHVGEADNDA
jgi:hypothetical protein